VLLGSVTVPFASKESHPVRDVTFIDDAQYTFEISGVGLAEYSVANDACRASPGQPCVWRRDAFYCYDSTNDDRCGSGESFAIPGIEMVRGWAGWFGSPTPSYNPEHTYSTTGPFFGGDQTIEFGSFFGRQGNCDEPEEGEPTCSGEFVVEVWGPDPDPRPADPDPDPPPPDPDPDPPPGGGDDDPCAAAAAGVRARAAQSCAAPPVVTVAGIERKVEVQRGGGGWEPATPGMRLQKGDKVHTGFKAGVTLTFPDGSTVRLGPMSFLAFDDFSRDAGKKIRVRLLLKSGEVKAQVMRLPGAYGDFQVKTPTTTASIRGTKFSVLYDGSATTVAVTESKVLVTAKNGRKRVIPAAKQTSSTAKRVSKAVKIGRGDKRGGVTAVQARERLVANVAKGLKACKFDALSNRLAPAKGGWSGGFVIVGAKQGIDDKPKGTAKFRLEGKKVSAGNALAEKIARSCR
jgi:hypothetical protein